MKQHFHFIEFHYAKQQIDDLEWKKWSLDSLLFVYSFTEVILMKLWNTPFRIQLNSVLNIRGITNQIIM